MKKNTKLTADKSYTADKVSLRECLSIFKNVPLPWPMMAVGFLFSILAAFSALKVANFSGAAVDANGDLPVSQMVSYVVTNLIVVACTVGQIATAQWAATKINYMLRQKLWHKVIVTKQSSYDLDGGESMVSRITSDCEFACKFYGTVVSLGALVVNASMYLIGMYQLNVQMANYVLLFIPASILLGAGYTVLRFLVGRMVQGKMAESTAYLVERTKDLPLIKTCNAQEREIAEGKVHFQGQYDAQLRLGLVTAVSTTIDSVLQMLSIAIPFLVGAKFVQDGVLTIGAVVTFNGLFNSVRGVFNNLVIYAGDIKEANGALARISNFFKVEEEHPDEGGALPAGAQEDLVLQAVDFGYTPDRQVLKDLSCRIPKNKVTAIVGVNGSGKSTLFKLLTRLYEPQGGAILFGGENCAKYSLHAWRRRICLIAQGSPMMAGTIRENMCYGRQDAVSDAELMEAAKLSHVWDFVQDLPDGFDTQVAAGGGNFSGGQKQCIAIARAMLSKADYLLLDEATSNLDVKREKDVMEAMENLMKGRTTVIIAHSLSTIRNADNVIVLNNGNLEAQGAPAYILDQTGNYLTKMMKRTDLA